MGRKELLSLALMNKTIHLIAPLAGVLSREREKKGKSDVYLLR